MKVSFTLLSICFSLPLALSAQFFPNLGGQRAGISAFSFLKIDASARSAAMAGASNCLKGDAFSTYTNVATFAEAENFTVGLTNTFWSAGTNYSYLSAGSRTKYGNFAGSLGFLTSGAMPVRTEFQPDGTGEYFYANYYSFGLSYAKTLTDFFSYGATLRIVNEQLAQYSATTGTLDLGFLYRTDYKDLSFAVNVQNFGLSSSLKGNWQLDSTFNPRPQTLDNYPTPAVFQLGISMIPYKADNQSLTVAVQLNHPNDNAENIRIGAEYEYRKLLYARVGYKINVKDSPYPTAGMGLRMRLGRHPLKLDYAIEPYRGLGVMHRVGLSWELNKEKRIEESVKGK